MLGSFQSPKKFSLVKFDRKTIFLRVFDEKHTLRQRTTGAYNISMKDKSKSKISSEKIAI